MVIETPEKLNPQTILDEANDQIRMVMIERYGFDRFIVDAKAVTLDAVGEYRLVSIPDKAWGSIKALKMICPSTGAAFVIPVDPMLTTVAKALDQIKGVEGYLEKIAQQT